MDEAVIEVNCEIDMLMVQISELKELPYNREVYEMRPSIFFKVSKVSDLLKTKQGKRVLFSPHRVMSYSSYLKSKMLFIKIN